MRIKLILLITFAILMAGLFAGCGERENKNIGQLGSTEPQEELGCNGVDIDEGFAAVESQNVEADGSLRDGLCHISIITWSLVATLMMLLTLEL